MITLIVFIAIFIMIIVSLRSTSADRPTIDI